MKPVHVRISNCQRAVSGDDREFLFQIWKATKELRQPYRIVEAPKTGDGDHYIITSKSL